MLDQLRAGLALLLGLRVPVKVAHYLTFRCNLACDMCGRRHIAFQGELETAACVALQREFRRRGTIAWSYSGGEPLLREDLPELCRSAKALGMRLILVTNGLLLPERLEPARLADVLDISIDGDRESHEALRGPGTYDRALAGLEAASRLRPRPKIVLQTVLNNQTIEPPRLEHMLRLAQEHRAELGFNPVLTHRTDERLRGPGKYLPTVEQFGVFREWLEQARRGPWGGGLFDSPGFFRALGAYPDAPRRIPCRAGVNQCVLDTLGRAFPCSDLFDFPERLLARGRSFGPGYAGFQSLPRNYPCGCQFCCTAKTNYYLARPWLAAWEFCFRRGPER